MIKMGLNEILLICAALLPAAALCIYIFKKDRVEKEPVGLLIGLLVMGCVICYPAAQLEHLLNSLINGFFRGFATEIDGTYYLQGFSYKLYHASKYFIGVALVEEGLKFLVMFLVTKDNKNFNSLFDGVVYAVFVSLGFAALENVLYVLKNGWMNALMRGILSVPGHMFFGVLMGYYYSFWHMEKLAQKEEYRLMELGYLSRRAQVHTGRKQIVMSLLMPVLAHGLYDYCCTQSALLATVAFYGFVLFLYIYCFRKIRKLSLVDVDDRRYSRALVLQLHPHMIHVYCPKTDYDETFEQLL